MSISVPIPKEITEYEEKIMFGLSIRKLICFVIAIVSSIGTYFLCTKALGMTMDGASYVIIIVAIPFMALGFIKKDGMPFEKYFVLFMRHKNGIHKLYYKPELVIDSMDTSTERKSEYAWIFEKKKTEASAGNQRAELRECKIFEITKKERKRKCKEARCTIKKARQDYRAAKRREKKAIKESSSAENNTTANPI